MCLLKKPEPVEPWKEVLHCFKHAPRAVQKKMLFDRLGPPVQSSEDCLYLNVFAPAWEPPAEQVTRWMQLNFLSKQFLYFFAMTFVSYVELSRDI